MGDVAMLVPVVERLHHTYPQLKISLLTKPLFCHLFAHLHYVNCIKAEVQHQHKGILGLYQLTQQLPADIDVVADMHEVLRSKVIRTLLRCKGKKIAQIDKNRKQKKQLTALQTKVIKPLPTVFEAYANVLEKLQLPIDLTAKVAPKNIAFPSKVVQALNIQHLNSAIGFAPFAAHQPKILPLEKSRQLLIQLQENLNREVLLFGGGEKEIEQLKTLAEGLNKVIVVVGKIQFSEELALIAHLSLMISMDSGNGHLAAMFQKPVLSIWGATHPYAGFTPFLQPFENQFTPDLQQYPLLPTSIYGNKQVEGYENAMESISIEAIVKRATEILNT